MALPPIYAAAPIVPTAIPLDQPAHPHMDVVQIQYRTPATPLAAVHNQTTTSWQVKCATPDCGRLLNQPKRIWEPVDQRDSSKGNVEVRYLAPQPTWCITCGAERFMTN